MKRLIWVLFLSFGGILIFANFFIAFDFLDLGFTQNQYFGISSMINSFEAPGSPFTWAPYTFIKNYLKIIYDSFTNYITYKDVNDYFDILKLPLYLDPDNPTSTEGFLLALLNFINSALLPAKLLLFLLFLWAFILLNLWTIIAWFVWYLFGYALSVSPSIPLYIPV